MEIKTNDSDTVYLTCLILQELKDFEETIKEDHYLRHKFEKNSRFKYLMYLRNRLIKLVISNKEEK